MNDISQSVQLIDFEKDESTNKLLHQIGLETELGTFLAGHVLGVLRKQYPNLLLESLQLFEIEKCDFVGRRDTDGTTVDVDSLRIPIVLDAIVRVGEEKFLLKLTVAIRATSIDDEYKIETDLVINKQMPF